MHSVHSVLKYHTLLALGLGVFSILVPREAAAQPTIRVDKSYEDTVRIMVLFNHDAVGQSFCHTSTGPVGPLTRDFVSQSLTGIPTSNIVISQTVGTTWDSVVQRSTVRWGAGKLPHVIVHLNAGWYSLNGNNLPLVLNTAAAQRIGVVSIGDDAAAFADQVFGFTNVNNVPPPMNDATQYRNAGNSLWLALDGKADTLPTPGVIRNTAESLHVARLDFKSFSSDGSGEFRCQADADKYTVLPAFMDKLSFLGFQRAYDGTDTIGGPKELQTIVAFQDGVRRGVALSFQPQFLKNKIAAHQVVYDAILYASFAHQFNLQANMFFTDENGVRLAGGSIWDPAKGKLYLTYLDDHRPNLEKTLSLSIRNRKGLAPSDSEAVKLRVTAVDSGRGSWKYVVDLKEAYAAAKLNGIAETYFFGEVVATIATHSFTGLPDGASLRADLSVARPDQTEKVAIQNAADSNLTVNRLTTGIVIQARDQDFSVLNDTVWATVTCANSKDAIARVALIEVSPGIYRSATILKTEGVGVTGDAVISCLDTDILKVVYRDEVYDKVVEDTKTWDPRGPTILTFTEPGTPNAAITSRQDGVANSFGLKVEYPTPSTTLVDTLLVVLTTSNLPADRDTIKVVETGANSAVFVSLAPITYLFQTTAGTPGSGRVEAVLDPTGTSMQVVVTGSVLGATSPLTKDLSLLSSYNRVVSAYIIDGNGNGAGDSVFVTFSRPLSRLPPAAAGTVFWNRSTTGNAAAPVITFLPGSATVVVYDFSLAEFPQGQTGIPLDGNPYVSLPNDNLFGGQQPPVADSIGPIIVKAQIYPFDVKLITKTQKELGMDTLKITLSERITATKDYNDLLRFSVSFPNGTCRDYSTSMPVVVAQSPSVDVTGLVYTILVNRDSKPPAAGNCVFLTADGKYKDLLTNLPPERGVKLEGIPPLPQLQVVRGYPPVVGSKPGEATFALINNEVKLGADFGQIINSTVLGVPWVAPVGYTVGQPFVSGMPKVPNEPLNPLLSDIQKLDAMPSGISTVQVVSTGRYIVDVTIFDQLGNFVKSFRQSFGYFGETYNNDRVIKGGYASYLVWDLKDKNNQRAGQGVYVWKMNFTFDNLKQEVRFARTGVLRNTLAIAP